MNKLTLAIAVLALVLAGYVAFAPASMSLGGTTNFDALTLDDGDLTISDGNIRQTTSNSATSTASVGCIQTTATSTATPIRLVPASSGATTTYTGANAFGVMAWQFGTCPI